jgi:hypothetical protein
MTIATTAAKDREASKRFKICPGCPVYHISEEEGTNRVPVHKELVLYALVKRIGIVLSAKTGATTTCHSLMDLTTSGILICIAETKE